ncbi:MAG TPA: lysophospholipid acyltransferase family protein [Anaerolineaceae bacterium]|nr:1-acyl-sn-glycerol-3-phosphate acyltransferase [Chloroflexota bacterium]HNS07564.1 lysophospholipid acyltransferase family protein [Anaerolineaceae bacterium]HOQ68770.1 lysophospholipid acyltransferase family protein [Anaerolineaceae bacterium]HQF68381.1 lysophospholipid acyltransferase family protein [Anaerolineaceae bacterium]HQM53889.1 lysophospholipid acyltransferase family protein [Anaerolineaceae bacterium]
MKSHRLRSIIGFLMKQLTRTEFIGVENIPPEGGVLIACNHMSRLDIPVLFITPNRPEITALVTTKYLKYPLLRWFIVTAEGIWLDRDTADFSAFRKAVEALKQGKALGIAPEGTRSQTAKLIEGKPGTALLALRTGVPIVPVAIVGTEDGMSKLLRLKRPRITAEYGKPIIPPKLDRSNREGQLQNLTDEVMCRIAAMMPQKYHGFYADHPRLKELLAEQKKNAAGRLGG